jgi:hypothetical protein
LQDIAPLSIHHLESFKLEVSAYSRDVLGNIICNWLCASLVLNQHRPSSLKNFTLGLHHVKNSRNIILPPNHPLDALLSKMAITFFKINLCKKFGDPPLLKITSALQRAFPQLSNMKKLVIEEWDEINYAMAFTEYIPHTDLEYPEPLEGSEDEDEGATAMDVDGPAT